LSLTRKSAARFAKQSSTSTTKQDPCQSAGDKTSQERNKDKPQGERKKYPHIDIIVSLKT
jgi:hypothetical protein